jgi:hypothetical protein
VVGFELLMKIGAWLMDQVVGDSAFHEFILTFLRVLHNPLSGVGDRTSDQLSL